MGKSRKSQKYYFAYGSNCNLQQMTNRCPRAEKVCAVTLPDYTLTFNGKSSGWGVANILPADGGEVKGLLWKITPECEERLDIYEGYPHLYEKEIVTVYDKNGEPCEAMVYVMTAEYDSPAMPGKQYYNGIWDGFRSNDIPTKTLRQALENTLKQIEV